MFVSKISVLNNIVMSYKLVLGGFFISIYIQIITLSQIRVYLKLLRCLWSLKSHSEYCSWFEYRYYNVWKWYSDIDIKYIFIEL